MSLLFSPLCVDPNIMANTQKMNIFYLYLVNVTVFFYGGCECNGMS